MGVEPLQVTQRALGRKNRMEKIQIMTQALSVALSQSHTQTTKDPDDEECCIILLFSHSPLTFCQAVALVSQLV